MLKMTTESGRVYLIDETEHAEKFKRLSGRANPFISNTLEDVWLDLLPGSHYEVGSSAKIRYGERWSEYLLTTLVVSLEEIPDE